MDEARKEQKKTPLRWRALSYALVALLLFSFVLFAWSALAPWLRARVTTTFAREVREGASRLTGQPCDLGAVAIDLRGAVRVEGLRCGPVLTLKFGQARILWRRSIAFLRLELEATLEQFVLDTTTLRHSHAGSAAEQTAVPPAWLTWVRHLGVKLAGHTWSVRLPYGEGETAALSLGTVAFEALTQMGPLFVLGNLDARQLQWRYRNEALVFEEFRGTASWAPDTGIDLLRVRLRGESVDLALRNRGAQRAFVHGTFPIRAIRAFVPRFPEINGPTFVAGWLLGNALNPRLELFLNLQNASWKELSGATLRVRFLRDGRRLDFRSAHLRQAAGSVSANVALELGPTPRLEVQGGATVRSMAQVLRWARLENARFGNTTFSGSFQAEGPLEPLRVHWQAAARTEWRLPFNPGAPELVWSWKLSGHFGPYEGSVWAQALWSDAPVVEARHEWGPGWNQGFARVELRNLAHLTAFVHPALQRLGLSGSIATVVDWSQREGTSRVEVAARARELTVLQSTLTELDCRARKLAGLNWELEHCTASDGAGGLLVAHGRWDFAVTGARTIKLEAKELAADVLVGGVAAWTGFWLPVSRGRVNATLDYAGHGTTQQLMARAELRQFRLYREPISGVRVEVDVENHRWRWLSTVSRRDGAEKITLRGRGEGGNILEATLEGDPISLGSFVGLGRRGVRGQLTLLGRWFGPITRPQGMLELQLEQLEVAGSAFGEAEYRMTFEPGMWSGTGRAFGGRATVNVQVTPTGDYPFASTFSLAELELAAGIAGKFRLQLGAMGTVSGFVRRWRIQRADVSINQLVLERDGYRLAASHPVRMSYDGVAFRLDPFELASGELRLRVAGEGRLPDRVVLDIQGTSDLALLELLGPPVVLASGAIEGDVHVEVLQHQWRARGAVAVRDASLEVDGFPPISKLNAQGTIIDDGFQTIRVEGDVGGGTVTLLGSATRPSGISLAWTISQASAAWTEDLEGLVSGEGTFGGRWPQLALNGDIRVESAVYDRNVELADLLRWLREQLFAPRRVQKALSFPLELNLKVYSPGNVFIDNNIARAELWLDLWIRGNIQRPLVGGRIGVLDGEVSAQGRTFTVTWGTIEFRDPATRNPWLNLVAETQIASPRGEYDVTVQVTGQADRPRVHLAADDPSLSQEDILSLIAVGRLRSAVGPGGFSPAGAALALVPKGAAEQRLQQWLAVDRFEVSAAQARDTGTVEPRVTVGKELSERLHASAWTSIGAQSRQAVQLEYRWSRRVSLLGTWESGTTEAAGAFGGDVKFRVELVRVPLSLCSQ